MAGFRRYLTALAFAALSLSTPAAAEELLERVLRVDPGTHTAPIWRADTDAAERFVVTGSWDRTVRVWSAESGRLLRTIPIPTGRGNIGKIYAVAIDPAGETIAAGGWTRSSGHKNGHLIYLFDRASGEMIQRIEGLPNVVQNLAFSPDGTRLVATLYGSHGMRLYGRDETWAEIARDSDYGGNSYGAAFLPDGSFVTTSLDGQLRRYDADGARVATADSGGDLPFGIAVHPEGQHLAVGFVDSSDIRVFDAGVLQPVFDADTSGIPNAYLSSVAWSIRGETLLAAGGYDRGGANPVVAWGDGGRGALREMPASDNTIMSLRPLDDGDLIVAAQDPWLGRMRADGKLRWRVEPETINLRGQERELLVSSDGSRVQFGYGSGGEDPAVFDVAALTLTQGPGDDLAAPDQAALAITNWRNRFNPALNGTALRLKRFERARSLAIHPDGDRFVLGTNWSLRAFDAAGTPLWRSEGPGVARAVNIPGNGRYVIAAYGDGTIRWHAIKSGKEQLALFPFADRRNWVAWTPSGHHASSPGADRALKWQIMRGWDQTPEILSVDAVAGFFVPEAIRTLLATGSLTRSLERAAALAPRSAAPEPDEPERLSAHLHLLLIGVSKHERFPHLDLKYADNDARNLAQAFSRQADLFDRIHSAEPLVDANATRRRILDGLRAVANRMRPGGEDVAVISFSGHGAEVDGRYYLLPHDVDASSLAGIEDTGISVATLSRRIARLAERGKVLVILDSCRSGSVIDGARAVPPDIDTVRGQLIKAGTGAIVITSSSGTELSRENDTWQNGALTEAVLEALEGRGGTGTDGWLSAAELQAYVVPRVQELTGNAQNPRLSTPGAASFEARLFTVPRPD